MADHQLYSTESRIVDVCDSTLVASFEAAQMLKINSHSLGESGRFNLQIGVMMYSN